MVTAPVHRGSYAAKTITLPSKQEGFLFWSVCLFSGGFTGELPLLGGSASCSALTAHPQGSWAEHGEMLSAFSPQAWIHGDLQSTTSYTSAHSYCLNYTPSFTRCVPVALGIQSTWRPQDTETLPQTSCQESLCLIISPQQMEKLSATGLCPNFRDWHSRLYMTLPPSSLPTGSSIAAFLFLHWKVLSIIIKQTHRI